MTYISCDIKIAELVDYNYHILAVLTRLGVEGGF